MVLFLIAMLMAPAPSSGSIGENRIILRDPQQGPMPVTDKYLLPAKVPQCTTPQEKQAAAVARIKGATPDCIMPSGEQRSDQPQP